MPRRIVVTGGSGFIGRAVVRRLVRGGDGVVVLVRDPVAARSVLPAGVELIRADLTTPAPLTAALAGADGVVHLAGSYRIGILASEHPAMLEANVGTIERVLDAAIAAGVPRVVAVSTVNAFGNTRGRIVDESYRRDPTDGFSSHYDRTKWLAHIAAEQRIAMGAPIVIAQPGVTYGPGDHTAVGAQLRAAYLGTAPYIALADLGVSLSHVDDVAAGIVTALGRGRIGEAYVLAGHNVRIDDAMRQAAAAGGRRPPRVTIPNLVLRIGSTLGPNLGGLFGLSPNLREIYRASAGVTYWASSAKAAVELDYRVRDLAAGFADTFGGAVGPDPAAEADTLAG